MPNYDLCGFYLWNEITIDYVRWAERKYAEIIKPRI